jgi:hypothetical protein
MEVLVSVAILSVSVTLLLQSLMSSIDSNALTKEYSHAIFLAEGKMWEMEHKYAFQEDVETGSDYGEFDPPFHDYHWETEVEEDEELLEYTIEVTVLWNHRSQEVAYTLYLNVPMRRREEDMKV